MLRILVSLLFLVHLVRFLHLLARVEEQLTRGSCPHYYQLAHIPQIDQSGAQVLDYHPAPAGAGPWKWPKRPWVPSWMSQLVWFVVSRRRRRVEVLAASFQGPWHHRGHSAHGDVSRNDESWPLHW